MRPGRPVVIASQTEDVALQVLHEAAFAQGCPRLHEQAELHHHNFSHVGGRLLESIGMYITNGEQEFEEGACPHPLHKLVLSLYLISLGATRGPHIHVCRGAGSYE